MTSTLIALQTFSHNALQDISIKPEPIMHIGSFAVTNSLFSTWIVMAFLIILTFIIRAKLRLVPKGLQNVIEMIVEGIKGMIGDVTGNEKRTRLIFPLIATIFIFVLFSNIFGLLPGVGSSVMVPESHIAAASHEEVIDTDTHGEEPAEVEKGHGFFHNDMKYVPLFRAPSSDLNFTFAIALTVMILVQVTGFAFMKIGYLGKFFNFKSVMGFFVGLLEFVSELGKILAFAFRLFGNIFAGEVLLVVMGSFLMLVLPMPFYGFEIFVAFIQAFVFAILSAAFLNLAMEHHS